MAWRMPGRSRPDQGSFSADESGGSGGGSLPPGGGGGSLPPGGGGGSLLPEGGGALLPSGGGRAEGGDGTERGGCRLGVASPMASVPPPVTPASTRPGAQPPGCCLSVVAPPTRPKRPHAVQRRRRGCCPDFRARGENKCDKIVNNCSDHCFQQQIPPFASQCCQSSRATLLTLAPPRNRASGPRAKPGLILQRIGSTPSLKAQPLPRQKV